MDNTEHGRSPSGPGYSAEPGPISVVPAVPVSIPNADAWRTDSPPFGKRPIWQYVWVQGERYHSGTTWFRQGWGTASIRTNDAEDGYQGFRRSDIERICRDNDMEPSCAVVVGWLPMTPPALLREEERRPLALCDDGEYSASAIDARQRQDREDGPDPKGKSAASEAGDAPTGEPND